MDIKAPRVGVGLKLMLDGSGHMQVSKARILSMKQVIDSISADDIARTELGNDFE